MLSTLHAGLYFEIEGSTAKLLLLASFGLFLLWQSLWMGSEALSTRSVALIALVAVFTLSLINWWFAGIEIAILFGLIGGRAWSFREKWERAFDLGAMLYLLCLLLLWVVPHLFVPEMVNGITGILMRSILPFILFLLLLIPSRGERAKSVPQDYFYSLLLFMLIVILVLSTFSFMILEKISYLQALARTVFMLASLLLVSSWLWNPQAGFSGLKSLFSEYLQGPDGAGEKWLRKLADIARKEQDEAVFLREAVKLFSALPWFCGIQWRAGDDGGKIGEESPFCLEERGGELSLRIWNEFQLNPAIELQYRLQAQIIAHFHAAKKREKLLAKVTRQQAIFETGSRLTHDMKNLLQSLHALSAAAAEDIGMNPFFSKQLPELTRRLDETLRKFTMPSIREDQRMAARQWWEKLQCAMSGRNIEFSGEKIGDISLPQELFDCVAENLLDNARKKRLLEPGIVICVHFSTEEGLMLRVTDSGSRIEKDREKRLFQEILPSNSGYGVGLYQASQWAGRSGFELLLEKNADGEVSFLFRASANVH